MHDISEASAEPNALPQTVATPLAQWNLAIDEMLETGRPEVAVALAKIILTHLPRHLPTYQRLLHATWLLKRWHEGADWGRRLLQADPGNPLAWRSVARSVEERGQRVQSHRVWRRAFEADPYDPEIRAGLSRTSLNDPAVLTLNEACLATLYLRGFRWAEAADSYRSLLRADPRRIDFQVSLLVALWQQGEREDTFKLAHHLSDKHPHILMSWVVFAAIGDENDKALARSPLQSLDPSGEFARRWLGPGHSEDAVTLTVGADEAQLLESALQVDEDSG